LTRLSWTGWRSCRPPEKIRGNEREMVCSPAALVVLSCLAVTEMMVVWVE
jgi:hypothetical protein